MTVAKKKVAKVMQKELPGLQKYASVMAALPQSNRKWISEELMCITESKEVANDLINKIVLDQVNSCSGRMGKAVVEAAISARLHIVPSSFGSAEESGQSIQAGGKEIELLTYDDREKTLASITDEYPNLIVVDAPAAVNGKQETTYHLNEGKLRT